jgi:hypothetical protein
VSESAPLPIQVVAGIAEFITVRAIFSLILRYLTAQRTRIVIVIDAICERLVQFLNGVEIGCWRHGKSGRARLRGLGSFGSCDVFFVAFSEQHEVLITKRVSPSRSFRFIENEPDRAPFGARFRLAVLQFANHLLDAFQRCGIFHAKNIAGLTANVN